MIAHVGDLNKNQLALISMALTKVSGQHQPITDLKSGQKKIPSLLVAQKTETSSASDQLS